MNDDTLKGKWHEIKGRIRAQWAKLTDDDVSQSDGNFEELSGRLQKTYGYSKDQANDEITKFRETLKH